MPPRAAEMSTNIKVKLLSEKRNQRVLFAEAGKDFVDFLFSLLALPVGAVIKLLTKQSMVGCIAELYESVENLSDIYMQPNQTKTALLEPRVVVPSTCRNLLTLENAPGQTPIYYACENQSPQRESRAFATVKIHQDPHHCITAVKGANCPYCNVGMNTQTTVVVPATATSSEGDEKGGYVKEVVTYMITDDLVVTPMSTISGLTLLNKFSIKDVSTLEEKVVSLGMEEGLKLLRASLESKTALTDVFLGKQNFPTDTA